MIRVLFVCLGNICRSPMAEAIFRQQVKEAGLEDQIQTDSAGTGDWHVGKPPHEGTRKLLKQKNIDAGGLLARQLHIDDFGKFDYIVAMDDSNYTSIAQLFERHGKGKHPRLVKMLFFHPTQSNGDVPDPYYTGNFEEVYELLDASCREFLEQIRKDNTLR